MEQLRRAWLVFLFLVDPGRTRLRFNGNTSDDNNNKSPASPLAPIVGRDVQIHQEPDHQAVDERTRAPPAPSGATPSQKRGVQLRQDRKRKWISEIRPSNGSKKVWLGSFNTFQEAAAAYDVGIFYFNKPIPYHFPDSPSFLRNLLPPATSEGSTLGAQELRKTIKGQAQLAAQRVRSNTQGKLISVIQQASHDDDDDHSNNFLKPGEVLDDHSNNSAIFPLGGVPNSDEFVDSVNSLTSKSLSSVESANTPASEQSPTRSDGVDIVERYWKEHDSDMIDSSIHGCSEGRLDSSIFDSFNDLPQVLSDLGDNSWLPRKEGKF